MKTPAIRGVEPDIGGNTAKYNSIFLYDPENLPEWLKDGWNNVFAEVAVPKDDVYVTKFGNDVIEEMDVEVAESKLPNYRDFENGNLNYDSFPLMFMYTEDIPEDDIMSIACQSESTYSSISQSFSLLVGVLRTSF